MASKNTKKTNARVRTSLLAALRHEVAELVRQDHIDALLETLVGTGYDICRATVTSQQVGRAILAVVPLVESVEDLACVVHTAAYHRHLKINGRHEAVAHDRAMLELAEFHAQATLDRAGPGVLYRFLLRMEQGRLEEVEDKLATSAEVH